MKANEFVKNHGWEYAKGMVIACESGFLPKNQNYDDLKRLVESYELVEKLGGLDKAKKKLSTERSEPHYNYSQQLVDSLKKTITDVESCQ